jgi:hypothetical protein
MAKSKAGKSKKDAKEGKKKSGWTPFVPSEDPILQRRPPEHWITVRVRSITWSVMDFSVRMLAEMPVFDLVSHIEKRHGGAINPSDLSIYKDEVHPQNLLSDLWLTLGELLPESRDEAGGSTLTFHYDFMPIATDCAVMLRAPNNLKVESALAEEKAAATRAAARRSSVDNSAARQSIDTTSANGRRASLRVREEANAATSRNGGNYLSSGASIPLQCKR